MQYGYLFRILLQLIYLFINFKKQMHNANYICSRQSQYKIKEKENEHRNLTSTSTAILR